MLWLPNDYRAALEIGGIAGGVKASARMRRQIFSHPV